MACWTQGLDAVRPGPTDDATALTAAQLREVVNRLITAGYWCPGDPDILIVMDSGYDVTRLAFVLADLPVQLVGRIRRGVSAGSVHVFRRGCAGNRREGSRNPTGRRCSPFGIRTRDPLVVVGPRSAPVSLEDRDDTVLTVVRTRPGWLSRAHSQGAGYCSPVSGSVMSVVGSKRFC
ncbi:transposase [Nocardiopsis terrae]|uniref:transposase n=1 Tax=Nocardiopsis terrae TaxID=372655 RepID=UPI00227D72A7|nr:transposase [Nocardiopsis terrae]